MFKRYTKVINKHTRIAVTSRTLSPFTSYLLSSSLELNNSAVHDVSHISDYFLISCNSSLSCKCMKPMPRQSRGFSNFTLDSFKAGLYFNY